MKYLLTYEITEWYFENLFLQSKSQNKLHELTKYHLCFYLNGTLVLKPPGLKDFYKYYKCYCRKMHFADAALKVPNVNALAAILKYHTK